MRLGDKPRGVEAEDFKKLADDFDISNWKEIVYKTLAAFEKWPLISNDCGISAKYVKTIGHKLKENIRRIEKGLERKR